MGVYILMFVGRNVYQVITRHLNADDHIIIYALTDWVTDVSVVKTKEDGSYDE